jgi:hypothetical protein
MRTTCILLLLPHLSTEGSVLADGTATEATPMTFYILCGLIGGGGVLLFLYLAERLTHRFVNFLLYGRADGPAPELSASSHCQSEDS